MKGVCTEDDWDEWKSDITVDYIKDNHFAELRDAEMLQNRLESLDRVQNYVGEYFSKEWVMKNVLMLSDENIEEMQKQMDGEEEQEPEEEPQAPPEQEVPQQEPQGQKHSIDINVNNGANNGR